ncbi:hypothetical protein EIP91_006727 [Steccherinum ochraceum]|uniref:Uncharacterized protein n=1 Tax=Steccherinum ochraceum TaxID=92696 RepID=A0A4V6N725_9APHY|nr:hypothetical protein EIP91_006727 [Steccherinum ochraceum]
MAPTRLAMHGSYIGLPASILLDPQITTSFIAFDFVSNHGLPATVTSSTATGAMSLSASGPVCIPTPSGWYSSTLPLPVLHKRPFDVVLGADFLAPGGVEWIRAPSSVVRGNYSNASGASSPFTVFNLADAPSAPSDLYPASRRPGSEPSLAGPSRAAPA